MITTTKVILKKAVRKYLSMDTRIDVTVARIDNVIHKLGEARSHLLQCSNVDENIKQVEDKIRELYTKRQGLLSKKELYVARAGELKAQIKAYKLLSGVFDISVDTAVADCDKEIKQLEAELDTVKFMINL